MRSSARGIGSCTRSSRSWRASRARFSSRWVSTRSAIAGRILPMAIVDPKVEAYAEAHTTPADPLLARLAEETQATLRSPQMLTGTVEGRFLELLVHGLGARRVLEIGTYSGYGALSMAAGLPPDGRIDTCEIDETHAEVARRYVAQSPYAQQITVHLGPALETIDRLEGTFDLVFIDADKENYRNYYEVTRSEERRVGKECRSR